MLRILNVATYNSNIAKLSTLTVTATGNLILRLSRTLNFAKYIGNIAKFLTLIVTATGNLILRISDLLDGYWLMAQRYAGGSICRADLVPDWLPDYLWRHE